MQESLVFGDARVHVTILALSPPEPATNSMAEKEPQEKKSRSQKFRDFKIGVTTIAGGGANGYGTRKAFGEQGPMQTITDPRAAEDKQNLLEKDSEKEGKKQ